MFSDYPWVPSAFISLIVFLMLLYCATEFVNTRKINIRAIPSRNTQYKQSDVLRISSIFLLTGKTREQCANFALTVFANYFQNTEFPTIKKEIWGKESMEKEIQEFAERRV